MTTPSVRFTALIIALSLALAASPGNAPAAPTESVISNFLVGVDDGLQPFAGLITDKAGALYGTTSEGGTGFSGTVFKLTPPARGQTNWTRTVLYNFLGSPDGFYPVAGLVIDKAGALYGTTATGGVNNAGTVFKLTPPARGQTAWTETVLYSFAFAGGDGVAPYGGVVMDRTGALYGTTVGGGSSSLGTVFKLTPPARGQTAWSEAVLYSFTGVPDGANTYASLIRDSSGALYGTTHYGGLNDVGTVFKLTPPARGQTAWSESVLYSFGATSDDGIGPYAALVMDKGGALYGTTIDGGAAPFVGGTVFKLTPPARGQTAWSEQILFGSFFSGTNGYHPYASLILDASGALYGTTADGGSFSHGTVIKLTPPPKGQTDWSEAVLYSFAGPTLDGEEPLANLVMDKSGALYGTTYMGGTDNVGTVFKLTQ